MIPTAPQPQLVAWGCRETMYFRIDGLRSCAIARPAAADCAECTMLLILDDDRVVVFSDH
jgi:hypothetical protein